MALFIFSRAFSRKGQYTKQDGIETRGLTKYIHKRSAWSNGPTVLVFSAVLIVNQKVDMWYYIFTLLLFTHVSHLLHLDYFGLQCRFLSLFIKIKPPTNTDDSKPDCVSMPFKRNVVKKANPVPKPMSFFRLQSALRDEKLTLFCLSFRFKSCNYNETSSENKKIKPMSVFPIQTFSTEQVE